MAARQQLDPQHAFQRADLAADRRLGDAQVLRRQRDAHPAADRDEAPDQVEGGQAGDRQRHSVTSCLACAELIDEA